MTHQDIQQKICHLIDKIHKLQHEIYKLAKQRDKLEK